MHALKLKCFLKLLKWKKNFFVEIQPVVVNRWQEKEGSKLFNPERDEEDEELQLAIKESLKEEQKRAKQLIQEELLYYELTR